MSITDPKARCSAFPPVTTEDKLIADFTQTLRVHSRVLVGSGDDCAVLKHPDGNSVVSTDVLVEGVHFRRDWMSLEQIGRRAAAQNAADIAAMGASAHSAVAAVTIPKDMGKADIHSLATGLACGLESYGYALVGGDLSSGPCLQVAVTVIGDLQGRAPLLRSGAKAGDLVYFAGNLGDSAAGLALLERFGNPDSVKSALPEELVQLAQEVISRYQVPVIPSCIAAQLAASGAHALMDISDGLSRDGAKIAAASGVVINLQTAKLAKYAQRLAGLAQVLNRDSWDWVLGGGEDHGLLCSAPPGFSVPGFTPIGEVVALPGTGKSLGSTNGFASVDIDDTSFCAKNGDSGSKNGGAFLLVDGKSSYQSGWDHFASENKAS